MQSTSSLKSTSAKPRNLDALDLLAEPVNQVGVDFGLLIQGPHEFGCGGAMFTTSGQAMRFFDREHERQAMEFLVQMDGDTGFDVDAHSGVRMHAAAKVNHTTLVRGNGPRVAAGDDSFMMKELRLSPNRSGEMAERLNAPDSKSGIPSRVSGVQIPLSPPAFVWTYPRTKSDHSQ